MAYILTLKDIRNQVLAWLDQVGDTGTSKTVIDDTIRRVHAARVTERKWNFMLWSEPVTFSTVVNQRQYSLHQEFFRPYYFYNKTTRNFMEQNVADSFLRNATQVPFDFETAGGVEDWSTASGDAFRFVFQGVSPFKAQPTVASTLTCTGGNVIITGDTGAGMATETLVSGVPGAIAFTKLVDVSVEVTGNLNVVTNTGAITVLQLVTNEYGRQYKQLKLMTTPPTVQSVEYLFYRQPSALGSDNSVPNIPAPYGSILTYDTLLALAAYNENLDGSKTQLWRTEQARLESGLIDFDEGVDSLAAASSYVPYRV